MAVGTRGPGSYIHFHVAQITSAVASSHSTTACNNQDNADRERNELPHSRLQQAVELSAGSECPLHGTSIWLFHLLLSFAPVWK